MKESPKSESFIRAVLQNEITWLFLIITGVFGFVSTVVLPIQKLQLQVTQIQTDLTDSKLGYKDILENYNDLSTRVTTIESDMGIKPLIK